jgi:hypothetical protein
MQCTQESKRRRVDPATAQSAAEPKVADASQVEPSKEPTETTSDQAQPHGADLPWYFVTLDGQAQPVGYRWHPHTTPDAARVEATLKAVHTNGAEPHVMAEPLKMATLLAWMFAASQHQEALGSVEPREQERQSGTRHLGVRQLGMREHEARMEDAQRLLVTKLLQDGCAVGRWEVLLEDDFNVWGLRGVLVVYLSEL